MDSQQDRFTPFYALWFVPFFAWFDATSEIENVYSLYPFLFLPCLALVLLIGVSTYATAMARHLWHRRWRRVISLVLAPVVVVFGYLFATSHGLDATWVRFTFNKSNYLADVAHLPQNGGTPKQMHWGWGGTGFAGIANSEIDLIYDESGAVESVHQALARGADPTDCLKILNCFDGQTASLSIRRLDANFYLATWYYD